MFYESHDLIKEAWTRSDVFSWEGRFYNYRYVNVWPRSYQQPHPPIWVTASAPPLIRWTAEHNYNLAFLVGRQEDTTNIFRIYRRAAAEYGLPEPGPEKFGSMVLCYVAPTAERARRMGEKLMWYFTTMNPRQKGRACRPYASLRRRALTCCTGSSELSGGSVSMAWSTPASFCWERRTRSFSRSRDFTRIRA